MYQAIRIAISEKIRIEMSEKTRIAMSEKIRIKISETLQLSCDRLNTSHVIKSLFLDSVKSLGFDNHTASTQF